MKLSYNTNPTKSTPIPHFDAWDKAFEKAKHDLAVSLVKHELDRLYDPQQHHKNLITLQQYNALLNSAKTATPEELAQLQKDLSQPASYAKPGLINNNSTPKEVSKEACRIAKDYPHQVHTLTLKRFGLDDTEPNRLRLCDPLWISRRLKREWRLKESEFSFLLSATALPCTAIEWVSDLAKRHYKQEAEQALKFAKNYSAVNAKGDVISGKKLFDTNKRDTNKYAEEVTVAKGLSTLAEEEGNTISALITATLPSQFHPKTTCRVTGKRIKNPKFNGCTIKEAHKFFQKSWELTRANLSDQGNKISHWVRAAQPHKTGAPHYHITAFLKDETHLQAVIEELSKQLNQPWFIIKNKIVTTTKTDPTTKKTTYKTWKIIKKKDKPKGGIQADIFTNKMGEIDIMGATNYIMASLAYIMPDDSHDGSTGRSSDEVKSIKNWAKKNNIKRFTTSHGHRTLWRKLRAADDFNSEAQRHAKAGDYAAFYRSLHIVKNDEIIKEGIEWFKTLTIQKVNNYGEIKEVPDSIFMLNLTTGSTHTLDISSTWEILHNTELTVMHKNQGGDADAPPQTQKPPPNQIDYRQLLELTDEEIRAIKAKARALA